MKAHPPLQHWTDSGDSETILHEINKRTEMKCIQSSPHTTNLNGRCTFLCSFLKAIIFTIFTIKYQITSDCSLWKEKYPRDTEWTLTPSDEICHIHGHLINLCVVKLLYVLQHALVVTSDEVDGHTLTAKPTPSSNPGDKK